MRGGELVLAVAGSRKTQSIIDDCVAASTEQRILVITYTTGNQAELRRRLLAAHPAAGVEVVGWFKFLIDNVVRPYLPFTYPGQAMSGFDESSPYQQMVPLTARRRYFTSDGLVRRVHLAQLVTRIVDDARSLPLRRLEAVYDHIYIDEVQDLAGYDLEVLLLLLDCTVPLTMVGDVRQAILSTSSEERKHKQFKNLRVLDWFRAREQQNALTITERTDTWRCRPEIASLADSLFSPSWGFAATVSHNDRTTDHDGVFLVRSADVDAYVERFAPQPLRWGAGSAKAYDHLGFMNFGEAKGLTRERVLIFPTEKMKALLHRGSALEEVTAAKLYVGVTRAEQSVAFVLDTPGESLHPYWSPPAAVPVSAAE
jgi:superfamily I DNA/RNA helicase